MNDAVFTYPGFFWLIPAGIISAVLAAVLFRNIMPTLFVGVLGTMVAYFAHEEMLEPHVEKWLEGQRVYAILFNDFPKDKGHFVTEFKDAYADGGAQAVAQKQQEMKIIMFLHHIPHYIERAHSDTIHQYIVAQAWLVSTLSKKDHNLCNQYLLNSKYFPNAWSAAGSDIFLASVRYFPQMIVEAVDSPETTTPADQKKAAELTGQMLKSMTKAGVISGMRTAGLCDVEYAQYYFLSQLPPKDGALVLKFLLGENHLKGTPDKTLLQQILPF